MSAKTRVKNNEFSIITFRRRIQQVQRLVRKHVKPGVSLADELIAERRKAARKE
ncbi:MAG TPA: AbrB/MazE/SpoVT family DNA-binding domain-containing protein [Candidatus Angelobacter sp.]|jgi:hypothetical protein|nr:AbrB/MazE/SpoVT family DNA-binding domain-containing protein [Candidatus Angelobacter sp.]